MWESGKAGYRPQGRWDGEGGRHSLFRESVPTGWPCCGPLAPPSAPLSAAASQKGRAGQGRTGYSRAGPSQLAEATGRLPHQVHGPPVGSQSKEHVVADLFVAEHLLLEERRRRRSPLALPACPLQTPGLPWKEEGAARPPCPHLRGGAAPADDNCISLIISMQPGHEASWDLSCRSDLRINDLGTEKHSQRQIDFLARFFPRRKEVGRCGGRSGPGREFKPKRPWALQLGVSRPWAVGLALQARGDQTSPSAVSPGLRLLCLQI